MMGAEQTVIGSVLSGEQVPELVPDDFFYPEHQKIWSVILVLRRANKPIDPFLVFAQLDKAVPLGTLTELERNTPAPKNVEHYAAIVRDLSQKRRLLSLDSFIKRAIDTRVSSLEIAQSLRIEADAILGTSNAPPQRRLLTLEEFVTAPTLGSQIDGIDPGQAIVVFFGPPKGGKTFTVCDLTMHAAHGLPWHGFVVHEKLRVAYLAGEGVSGLKVRLKAWLECHDGINEPGDFRAFPYAFSLPGEISNLVTLLQEFKPQIVVADTLNAYFGSGDENGTQDMTLFCNAVRLLRDTLQCSVYIIHHTGHGDPSRERGSIVLRATADVLVQIGKDENNQELVGFQLVNGRDISPMESAISLRLVQHETEWKDKRNNPLVSCVVESADEPVTLPGRGNRDLGGAQIKFLDVIHELAKRETANSAGEVILVRSDVASVAVECGMDRRRVSQNWKTLANRKLIRLIEPGSVAIRPRRRP